jgi:MOSC domain-containing protein YiiM
MPETAVHRTTAELEAGLDEIRRSPVDAGAVRLIVRRPEVDRREVVADGELSLTEGLVGDNWARRGAPRSAEAVPPVDTQLTVMNARAIALIAEDQHRWPLAGDQFFVDLDLSEENLPALTRLTLGTAVIEVSAQPHTGCRKFVTRFGMDAMTFVNSPTGKRLRLRGLNARVVRPGVVRVGDLVRRVAQASSEPG